MNGNQRLTPDQRIAPTGYLADGSVSSAAIADGAVSSAKLVGRTSPFPIQHPEMLASTGLLDFRSVDYEAISMLNVSATQELARRLEAKDTEIAALKKQLADNAARDKALEARLAALEQNTPAASARAVKVAMNK